MFDTLSTHLRRTLAPAAMIPLLAFALVFSGGATAPAQAQDSGAQLYWYAGGKKRPLTLSSRWAAVKLQPGASLNQLSNNATLKKSLDPTEQPLRAFEEGVAVLPVAPSVGTTGRRQLSQTLNRQTGIARTLRVFGNGSSPMVETDELLVRFKPGTSRMQAAALLQQFGAQLVEPLGRQAPNGYVARVTDAGRSALGVANALYERGETIWSQPNFITFLRKKAIPDDPLFGQQFYLRNTGQAGGTADADIDADEAWDMTLGNRDIIVAVSDDGVDLDHEDLKGDSGRIVAGYDYGQKDTNPRPVTADDNHGTAVAGVALGVINNGIGIAGVAPNCRLMALRVIADGVTNQALSDSFRFAADNGASVINCSWGPEDNSAENQSLPDVVRDGINYATEQGRGGLGCVIVFAAGNGNENADTDGFSSYERVISVAATTNTDIRASYSDFGESVDVAAPGGGGTLGMITTDRTGTNGYATDNYFPDFLGTSAAAPVVSGVAALVLSVNPGLNYIQVRQVLQATADKVDPQNGKYDANGHSIFYGYGRINARRALEAVNTLPSTTLSGHVLTSDGAPVSGVTIATSTGGLTLTDENGAYRFDSLPLGQTRVTPSKQGYSFDPAFRDVELGSTGATADFVASAPAHVTLLAPPANSTISSVYTLQATTTNNAAVQRMDFERRQTMRFERGALNQPINDNSTTSDTIQVAAPGTAGEVAVRVHVEHGYLGDVSIRLVAPDGNIAFLYDRTLGSARVLDTTFDAPDLAGSPLSGGWTLEVTDHSSRDTGTLISWSLILSTPYELIGSDVDGADSEDKFTALWDTTLTPNGTYEVRAKALTVSGEFTDTHENVTIANATSATPTPTATATPTPTPIPTATPVPVRYSLSGRVTTTSGFGLRGVTVTRRGNGATVSATTNERGEYSFGDLAAGTYTLTPVYSGLRFSPSQRTLTVGPGYRRVDFIAYVGSAAPAPPPAPEPIPGTVPTAAPTSTPTAQPTATAAPTATARPTATPAPTATAGPTATSAPTATARPTATPVPVRYSLSGRVTTTSGFGLRGVTVTRRGNGATVSVTTNERGEYSFGDLAAGTYTLTPVYSGLRFSPPQRTLTVGPGYRRVDFIAYVGSAAPAPPPAPEPIPGTVPTAAPTARPTATVAPTPGATPTPQPTVPHPTPTAVPTTPSGGSFSISGLVTTSGGFRLNGITVTLSGNGVARSAVTSNGEYSFGALPNGTYTVQPRYPGLRFTPGTRTVTISGGRITGVNFIATVG